MAEAVRAAVRTHPSIRGAREQVRQADEGVEAARAGYRPQITGGIEGRTNSYRNSSYDSRHVYTATVNASQMLYDFGKVAGAARQARAGVRASEAQVEWATDEIAMNTAQAWVDAHLQQALVALAREQLDAVMAIASLVGERVAKGATSRSDLEQANSRVEALRSQLLGAEAEAQRASLALMHLTGRAEPVRIRGDIPTILRTEACQSGVNDSTPGVRMAEARRDDARAQLDIARAERLPTVTLDGSVGYALTDGSRLYGEHRSSAQVGVNFAMPLYQGGSTGARERGAYYQLRSFEDAVHQARLEARQGLADARAQLDGWAGRAPVLDTRVRSIDATRDLYRQQYLQLGSRSLLDLLNAEQEYHGARVDQIQGVYLQYRLAVQCLYHRDQLRSAFGLEDAGSSESAITEIGAIR
ncbi:TolC family outer membrane protein [Brevundimonas diminuta]|uniref:TolC family outer membrane protein n=1 Tax=Brevundimonas diminuta TaxID=293 RepID=UPI0032095D27